MKSQITLTLSLLFLIAGCNLDPVPEVTPSAKIQATFSLTNDGCEAPCSISFQNESSGEPSSFEWNFGDPTSGALNSSTEENPIHEYLAAGTYSVSLIIKKGSSLDSTSQTVTILSAQLGPKPTACFSTTLPTKGCFPGCIAAFNSDCSLDANSYAWNFGDPNSGSDNTSTEANPSHTFHEIGKFTVRLIVTASNGQKDTLSEEIEIRPITFSISGGELGKDEEIFSVEQTTDGGYFFVGVKEGNIWWAKTDQFGTEIWSDIYASNCANPSTAMAKGLQAHDGSYLIVGDICVGDKNKPALIKLTSSGALSGAPKYIEVTTSSEDIGYAVDIFRNENDQYLVLFMDEINNEFKIKIARFDVNKNYSVVYSHADAGIPINGKIAQTSDGGYIVKAKLFAIIAVGNLTMKLTSTFNNTWTHTYPSSFSNDYTPINAAVQLNSGDIIAAGSRSSEPVLIKHLLGDGTITANKGFNNLTGTFQDLIASSDNRLVGCGTGESLLMKMNANLNEVWRKTDVDFPNAENGTASWVKETQDGGYIIGGKVPNGNTNNYLLIKTDALGNVNP